MIKFKFIEYIQNVNSFDVRNDLYYLTKDLIIPGLAEVDLNTIADKHVGVIFIAGDLLIWQDGRGKSAVYDFNKSSLIFSNSSDQREYTFKRLNLTYNGLLLADTWIDEKEQLCYFKINDSSFESIQFDISKSLANGQILLNIVRDREIVRIDMEGNLLWKFQVSGKYYDFRQDESESVVKSILGLYHDTIWICLTSGELIGLDQETGKLYHRFGLEVRTPTSKIEDRGYFFSGELMQLDDDKGEIIGLRGKNFIRVDVNQQYPRQEYTSVSYSMDAHSIISSYRNQSFPYDQNYIYFCDDRQGKIGVFDRDKLEVVWSYELEMERDGIAQILDMKYANNRWYILDRNSVLHVFERVS